MKKILIISGSRADYGLLEYPAKVLAESFEVDFRRMDVANPADAYYDSKCFMEVFEPDCLLILGDRWEILQAAITAHLKRIPIAHIAGGDKTLGSYDDAMRDCISRLATIHFPTSEQSRYRLSFWQRYSNVYMIGNLAMDFIINGDWKRERPLKEQYVVVSYQPETIDNTVDLDAVNAAIAGRKAIWITPNPDFGSERIPKGVTYERADFLNLLYHCEEFIGNSSSMFYEAPALGVKTRIIGKRQEGRVYPTGDGKSSERIREALCTYLS